VSRKISFHITNRSKKVNEWKEIGKVNGEVKGKVKSHNSVIWSKSNHQWKIST
jgi:hypothetical protein